VAFINKKDLKTLYNDSKTEAHIWRQDYPAYERLMDNGLMEGLDTNLPEVNDGSLAAALFKLPKRIVSSKLAGFAKAVDRDEAWITELANIMWKNEIIPNANTQAPFIRKWKDAVRKAAGYGSVPLITMFIEKNGKQYSDFIVAQPQDVTLEPGKVSDYDSDIIFWDIYYTKTQLQGMIDEATEETTGQDVDQDGDVDSDASEKSDSEKAYNKWNIPAMQAILDSDNKEERSSLDTPRQEQDKNVRPTGFKFCIAYQRGVNAPFYMYHKESDKTIREWSNPDPTGDIPVHFLYCYQDFINPYGIGICKLAGGTQNVLDYMRQADVLATQLGLRPPINIQGNADDVDIDSLVYAQDALWFTGAAVVKREELANGVYSQLPQRMEMYKASLNNIIPTGDTSVSSGAGDPTQSKTPAGVRQQVASLSIDDEDFKDNLFITYEAVAKSMINTQFANMEGTDVIKLSDEEKQKLYKIDPVQFAPFMAEPDPTTGKVADTTNQLEVIWDTVRAQFSFEIDPTSANTSNDADQATNIQEVIKTITPQVNYFLGQDGWKYNGGEAYRSLLTKLNLENIDSILTKMTDEEAAEAKKQPFPIIDPPSIRLTGQIPNGAMIPALAQGGVTVDPSQPTVQEQVDIGDIYKDPSTGDSVKAAIQQMAGFQPEVNAPAPVMPPAAPAQPTDQQPQQDPNNPVHPSGVSQQEAQANVDAVMKQYGVDEQTALTALAAEHAGLPPEDVIAHMKHLTGQVA